MHDVLPAAVTLTGSGLCLAGHVPGPVRRWGPHAVVLAVTLAMVVGSPGPYPLLVGAGVTAGMCLFTRGPVAADLAVMAVVTAAMARLPQGQHDHHTDGHGLFALAVVLWVLARASAFMHRALRPGVPCGSAKRCGRRDDGPRHGRHAGLTDVRAAGLRSGHAQNRRS